MNDLNRVRRTSFSIRAKMMGGQNPKTNLSELIVNVFLMIRPKKGEANSFSKCLSPTHGLAVMPSRTRKSLKAITTP